jgi:glycosyltransferase involved in cell wall biosynthesis
VDLAVGIKPYPNCWLALWIAQLRGASAVMDVDDLDSAWRGGFLGKLFEFAQAPAFRIIRRFSTHHPGIRARLNAPGKILELGQGVDTGIFREKKGKTEKSLVFTAHLNVACQLGTLLPLIAPWLKKHPDWRLVVAGGGPLLGSYRRQFESGQVFFTGALEPEMAAAWIQKAGICVAAYARENGNEYRVPMKTGEYLACGKPVVSNFIPGLAPLRRYLYLCHATPEAFSRQLERLRRGGGDHREAKGAAWIRKTLSWDAVAERFLKELG